MRTKYEEYLVCLQRGHAGNGGMSVGGRYYSICDYCGTHYWTEHIQHETNVPERPTPKSRREAQ